MYHLSTLSHLNQFNHKKIAVLLKFMNMYHLFNSIFADVYEEAKQLVQQKREKRDQKRDQKSSTSSINNESEDKSAAVSFLI